jgi:predicted small lipoprotein YifL
VKAIAICLCEPLVHLNPPAPAFDMRNIPAILVISVSLAGCGMKGALYLPPAKAATAKPVAPQPELLVTPDPKRPVPSETPPPPK